MGKIITGVTLQTLPRAVREAGLKPGQRFTVIVEGDTDEDVFAQMQQIADTVSARVAADGFTEDDVMRILNEEDDISRNQ